MNKSPNLTASFFYLLALLPMGLFGFVYAVVGIALSIGLMPIFIGFPLLLFVLRTNRNLTDLDARLASRLLGLEPQTEAAAAGGTLRGERKSFWALLGAELVDARSFSALLWQFIRLPLGILAFAFTVSIASVILALLVSPVVYWILLQTLHIDIFYDQLNFFLMNERIDSMQLSLIYTGLGILAAPVGMIAIRKLAQFMGAIAIEMTRIGAPAYQPAPQYR
ncbi:MULTISPECIES: sensor domain-containing protein [Paenibacillus]|uniref:sensor domain-containing protein n=1 Tax=Paenibacillus TaxID=44249 RepID=UPI001C2F411F|nr:sensor domain-containing protein [Paenibacillus sp. GbtcB18]